MPGRTQHEAREAFLQPLKRALSCVTNEQLFTSYPRKAGEPQALTLSKGPLRLRRPTDKGGDLYLTLAHRFEFVEREDKKWKVRTIAYDYRLDDSERRELLSWHWHPAPLPGADFPHVHVSSSRVDRKAHVPTGRVSIESILRLLLTDLEVKPRPAHRDDFLAVLDECEQPFIKYRTWHA